MGELLDERSQYDLAEFHWSVIALQNERPGLALVGITGNRGQPLDLTLIDDLLIVEHDGHRASHQSNVVRLPFAGGFAGIHGGSDTAIQSAIAVLVWRLAVILENLHLVAS